MSIFIGAVYVTVIGLVMLLGGLILWLSLGRPESDPIAYSGVCAPSRQNTLTGAYQEPQTAIHDDSQVEIERLKAVIRQRNRMIKRLRSELEQQPVEMPVMSHQPATLDRFANLEIRGQS
jgi:hypothetical protein